MLNDKRIYLRLIEREDCIHRTNWVNDEEIRQTLMFEWPLSLSGTYKWFDMQLLDNTKKNFVIVSKENQQVIGMTGLIDIDYKHLRGQFYLTIGDKEYWGKRIPDESIPLILQYGFNELGLNRIYLYTLNNNERARKVYMRNGFKFEGILREHYFCVGKHQDLHVMSILKSEWKEMQ
jgi:diamine N-acetyltransferase